MTTKKANGAKREERLREAAAHLRILVGQVIESLESYDSDDGHNDLVLAGVTAEIRRIERTYEDVLFNRPTSGGVK